VELQSEDADRPAVPPSLRILAAEDNATNQIVLRALLDPLGVQLVVASHGLEALAAFKVGHFDLVLMDIQMPVMDGLEAARTIRAAEVAEGRRRTPIIAVTANATPPEVAAYAEAGMDGCVPKPVDPALLMQTIEDAVEPAEAEPSASPEVLARPEPPADEEDEGRRRRLMLLLAGERAKAPEPPILEGKRDEGRTICPPDGGGDPGRRRAQRGH
jgi:CheY-like chemotaxis protein